MSYIKEALLSYVEDDDYYQALDNEEEFNITQEMLEQFDGLDIQDLLS